EHLATADRAVIEKATKGQLLVAVIRQRMDAGGRVLTHRIQQIRTDAPKPRIAKAPKIILKHANRPPTKVRCHRITVQSLRESIRSCANAVDSSGGGGGYNPSSDAMLGLAARLLSPPQQPVTMPVHTTCQQ